MGFPQLALPGQLGSHTPSLVFFAADRFQVVRVDAMTTTAKMVELQTFRNRATHKKPRRPVCFHCFGSLVPTKASISLFLDSPNPKPARKTEMKERIGDNKQVRESLVFGLVLKVLIGHSVIVVWPSS